MTTKGPKKPAGGPGASRPSRPSKTASAKKTTSAARPPKRTLSPAVDVDRELPKIFGGSSPASRPKPPVENAPASEPPLSYRAELVSTARLEEVEAVPPPPPAKSASSWSDAILHDQLDALDVPAPKKKERSSAQKKRAASGEAVTREVDAMAPAHRVTDPDAVTKEIEAMPEDKLRPSRRAEPVSPPPAVVAQIRELEAQLDRLIDEASRRDLSALAGEDDEDDDDDGMEVTNELPALADVPRDEPLPPPSIPRPIGSSAAIGAGDKAVFDTARELLSTDFYLRKWGRLAMRGRSEEVDDFGFDPIYDQKFRGVLEFLYTRYFRVEQTGIDRVPSRGRCLLVANHSGTLPLDGVMIKTAVKLEHPAARDVRWLTEDFIYHMPYLGSAMNRLGAVRACQENAERLLAKEQLVAVFPEGVKGIGKLFAERYRLQRFGRGGFIKLCLRTQTPIVPVAVVGAEETNPMLFRIEYFAKALGVPYVPVTPTFPLLGPAGLLPAPTKWQIHFGEPIDFSSHGADAADDEILVGKLAERVRATIQGMLDRAVGSRKSVFF